MMLTIQQLAIGLIFLHMGSVIYISMVLRRQFGLFKVPISPYLNHFRKVLFTLSCIVLLGNVIPILIDVLTLFVQTGRPAHLRIVSILYAFSNGVTALISAYLIWKLYHLAADTKKMTDFTEDTLKAERKKR